MFARNSSHCYTIKTFLFFMLFGLVITNIAVAEMPERFVDIGGSEGQEGERMTDAEGKRMSDEEFEEKKKEMERLKKNVQMSKQATIASNAAKQARQAKKVGKTLKAIPH